MEDIKNSEPRPFMAPPEAIETYPVNFQSIIISGFYGKINSKINIFIRLWYWLTDKHILSYKLVIDNRTMGPWWLKYRELTKDLSFTTIFTSPIEIGNEQRFDLDLESRMRDTVEIETQILGGIVR